MNTKKRTAMPLGWLHELKVRFQKSCLKALQTRNRGTLGIVLFMGIGFFAGASGTYLFEHGLHLSLAALLSIAAILAAVAISAVLKYGKLDRAQRARPRNNTGQIPAWREYRPRDGIQRHGESEGAEPVDALSVTGPATDSEDTVWFDFIPIESPATDEPTNSLPQSPTTKVP